MNKLFRSVLTGALRNQHTKTLRRLWELSVSPTTWKKSSWSFWFVSLLFLLSENKKTCFSFLEMCFIQMILLSVPLMQSGCAWPAPVSHHFVDCTLQSLILCVTEVLIAVSVREWGHNKEGQHDEWHALQEPPHQAVSHAEERRGQQAAGGICSRFLPTLLWQWICGGSRFLFCFFVSLGFCRVPDSWRHGFMNSLRFGMT